MATTPVLESAGGSAALSEARNVQAIAKIEHASRAHRTRMECVTDAITRVAGSPSFIVVHVVWFAVWIGVNTAMTPFDPYPYSLLTLAVSLEAILLSGFLLMAQNRMTRDADRRTHLDLQVNLLAEQELTAILRILLALGEKAGVDVNACAPELADLQRTTDVEELATLVQAKIEADEAASDEAAKERA